MTLYLDKLLAQCAYPLGLTLILGLLGVLFLVRGRKRMGVGLMLTALVWLWVWSLPVVSDGLRNSLEANFRNVRMADVPQADAAVVLGGAMDAGPPGYPYPNLGPAADRVWHAARLYHAGKAGRLILSGGSVEWQGQRVFTEAQAMRTFLSDLGVPDSALVVEDGSRSTRENALFTAELLHRMGLNRVLLVTSALHMPRALATFRAAGVAVIPAPTDFEVMPEPAHVLRWLPDAAALADSTRAMKEYLGLWMYRWRGWAL